jgi:succinate dehydrogenase / fumarate reductase cytochrome b subunit
MVARNTDGKLVSRPLSPHLQVYRWPVAMAVSILHRMTGCALAVGTLLMTWWLVAAAVSDNAFANVQWFLASWLGLLVLFGWTFALFFHLFSGLRHLAWNALFGFERPQYRTSNWLVFGGAVGCTVLTWIVGLAVW